MYMAYTSSRLNRILGTYAMFKDAMFEMQWLRAAGHSAAGGADLGECLAVANTIRERDLESWRGGWTALAERVEAEGKSSLARGHTHSAHTAFLRACNYFRSSYVFEIGSRGGPRLIDAYRRQRTLFAKALAARPRWGETIAIPHGVRSLHGYFFQAAGASPRPTLISIGGYDSTAEEVYFYSGAAALARGYNVVTFDGPGQGKSLIEDGLKFRPDWETVLTAVLDYLRTGRRSIRPASLCWASALAGISPRERRAAIPSSPR